MMKFFTTRIFNFCHFWIQLGFKLVSVLAAACIRIRGLFSIVFYMPWILVTASVILVDIIAAGYYGMTIAKTSSWFGFLQFMGVTNMWEVRDSRKMYFPEYSGYTTPAICATLFCIRFLFFWAINIYLLYVIYKIFRVVIHQKEVKKSIFCPPCPGESPVPQMGQVQAVQPQYPPLCSNVLSKINLTPSFSNFMLPVTPVCPLPTPSCHSCLSCHNGSQQSMVQNPSQCMVANPRQQKGILDYLLDCC